MKLINTIKTFIKAFITAQKAKLRVSPITQRYCDKKLLEAVNKTAIYGLARKSTIFSTKETGCARDFTAIEPQQIGGELTYMSTPPAFGRVFPWPCPFVRYFAELHGQDLERNLDSAIVQQLADKSLAKDRVTFKKCMTKDVLEKAAKKLGDLSGGGLFTTNPDNKDDGWHFICITSLGRIGNLFSINDFTYEVSEEYQDYIDRKLYPGEHGRYKLHDGFYIVFLTTLDDRMMHSLLFGPDAITMIPLEKNLRTIFRYTPAGETGRQPRGFDVGYYMELGAEIDQSRCVILEATRRLEKEQ
jgi:hypothetical protein